MISSKTGPGVNRAAQALRMASQTLYRSQSALGDYFRRERARFGTPQAITDTAHKMARIIYHLVTRHVLYDDNPWPSNSARTANAMYVVFATKLVRSVSSSFRRPPDYVFLKSYPTGPRAGAVVEETWTSYSVDRVLGGARK